jgi:hypothetical protein
MATLVRAPGYKPVHVKKVGRNELCPCGSGKKVKKCNCGLEKQYFFLRSEQENKQPKTTDKQ